MATSMAPAPQHSTTALEDPLAYLPCSTIFDFRKGQTIYGEGQPSTSLYLVREGKVTISRTTEDGRPVVIDIYRTDDIFGESALVGELKCTETAVALTDTLLMRWTIDQIEDLATRRPRLAVALLQLFARRSMDFGSRIESLAVDNIARRLARGLIHFSERLGKETEDGSVEMIPFTHEFLSQYVGTSREIITHYMNQLRRQGYLRYSRKGIQLHRDAMKDWLRQETLAA